MIIKIKSVETLESNILNVKFTTGIQKQYNMKNLIDTKDEYRILLNKDVFNSFKITPLGSAIEWTDEVDISAEKIWYEGEIVGNSDGTEILKSFTSKSSFNEDEYSSIVNLNINLQVPKYLALKLNLMDESLDVYYDGEKLLI